MKCIVLPLLRHPCSKHIGKPYEAREGDTHRAKAERQQRDNRESRGAIESNRGPQGATQRHREPRSKIEPQRAAASDKPASLSACCLSVCLVCLGMDWDGLGWFEYQRATENHREPQRAKEGRREQQRGTESNIEQQKANESNRKPQRPTGSHRE